MAIKSKRMWGVTRNWTLFAAWMQLMVSLLVLIYGTVSVIELNKPSVKVSGNTTELPKVVKDIVAKDLELTPEFCSLLWLLTLISMTVQFMLGVTLMYGVILKNSRILLSWCLVEIAIVFLTVYGIVWMLSIEQYVLSFLVDFALAFLLFWLYVVNNYRLEIQTTSYRVEESEKEMNLTQRNTRSHSENEV